jgi:hypothetical protein
VATPALGALDPAEAEASAYAAVREYLALFDEISADPDRDVAELEQVAGGRALDWAMHQITTWRDAGQTGIGAQVASGFGVTATDLEPASNTDGWYPSVEITACVDLSDTDLIDENGDSVVPGDRPGRVLIDFIVANLGWPTDQQWRVVRDDDQLTDSDPPEFVPCP